MAAPRETGDENEPRDVVEKSQLNTDAVNKGLRLWIIFLEVDHFMKRCLQFKREKSVMATYIQMCKNR